jgi:GNAT superfamily N-acetyltransferase
LNIYFSETITPEIEKYILQIIEICDSEFVPHLSSRKSEGKTKDDTLKEIVETLRNFPIVYIKIGKQIVSFVSVAPNIDIDFKEQIILANFINLTCVLPNFRNIGLATKMYNYVEQHLPKKFHSKYVCRYTWSTNKAQIHIIEKSGYKLIKVKKDARGKGIHSVKYLKKLY